MGRVTRTIAISGVSALALAGCGEGGSPESVAAPPAVPAALAQTADASSVGGEVTVVGEGKVQVTPDTARVVLGVEVTRPEVSEAFAEASAVARDVLEAVQAAGVPEENLQTVDLSVREERELPPPGPADQGPPEITGYTVTNLVEVTMDDPGAASDVIAAAVEAGGNAARVQSFQLVVDQEEVVLDEARAAAFEDARERAALYADLAGRELGELESLSEVVGGGPVGPPVALDRAFAEAAPPIQPGQQELTVRIQATWSLA